MENVVLEKQNQISGKVVVGGFGVLFMLVVGMVLALATGIMETLGYESRNINGNGLTNTQSGYSWGLNTFYFVKGQDFFAEYETVILKGSLVVHLYKIGTMPSSETPYHRKISQSGKGTVKFPIQESGLYRMSFSGSVLGAQQDSDGYDLSYHIRWGIR
ncbi:MAG: hypothetical protein NPIRA03_19290 [Nitrospirales bacterium]|nr:MAG: hypothetical protein NPIRA03_19290 [Nitrospirales bacterium]